MLFSGETDMVFLLSSLSKYDFNSSLVISNCSDINLEYSLVN